MCDVSRDSFLTDNPNLTGWVFLEMAKRRWTFGNAWALNDAIIIFKGLYFFHSLFSHSDTSLDVCGKLEGKNIISSDIQNTPNLWYYVKPPPSNVSWPLLPEWSSPLPTMSVTQLPMTSPTGELMDVWREPGLAAQLPLPLAYHLTVKGTGGTWKFETRKGLSYLA
jgi:hypothetical protein